MKVLVLFIILLPFSAFSQSDTVFTLIAKGDTLMIHDQFEQASYFYHLAKRNNTNNLNKDLYDSIIDVKILDAESQIAYAVKDLEYIELICSADSLTECCEILALRNYEKALNIIPGCSYPSLKIDEILNSSPEIQKKLLVISSKRKHKQYLDDLDLADFYLKKEEYFKAYKLYEIINIYYPDDTLSDYYLKELYPKVESDLNDFEAKMKSAEFYLSKDKFKKAKRLFEEALTIDSECNICHIKLKSIEYLERKKQSNTDWNKLKKEADDNYKQGNYEMAQHQYLWLVKHDPSDEFSNNRTEEISKILEDEVDEKHAMANAKLLLEKADASFISGDFKEALELYKKIANRYEDATDNLLYVLERIKDCKYYISLNEK